jgi:hypothetical protein
VSRTADLLQRAGDISWADSHPAWPADQARGGPRWGRSRAVNGRSASDNYGEPRASSVQLSGSFWPSTAAHGQQPIRSDTEEVTTAAAPSVGGFPGGR